MDATTSSFAIWHAGLSLSTERPIELLDITNRVEALVRDSALNVGIVSVQSLHTTTAVVVNEHEPGLLDDFAALLGRLAPAGAPYSHDARLSAPPASCCGDERVNGHSHCQSLLLPTSVSLHVHAGRLQLGRWQRLFLVELDGPRPRDVSIVMLGEGGR